MPGKTMVIAYLSTYETMVYPNVKGLKHHPRTPVDGRLPSKILPVNMR